jgi:hypothetical protein
MLFYDTDSNLCAEDNGGCKELCLYVGSNKVNCACSYSKLAADGKSCEGKKTPIFSKYDMLKLDI